MESEEPGGTAALPWTDSGWPDARGIPAADSAAAVAALYQNHAVGLIRLAYLMLGDRASAEDAVQDAFCGLYRHWDRLTDHDRALAYVRTAVLNACRSALRRRASGRRLTAYQPPTASAEATVLGREERQEVMRAVLRLPGRRAGSSRGGSRRAAGPYANSRPVAGPPPGAQLNDLSWRGAIITPDGRTVVIVEELASNSAPIKVRDRLLKVSVATGRVTVLNDRNILAGYQYEQVMYSSATGSVLVVSGVRKGITAGVLRGNRYTPIPWDRHIATAIW